MCFGGLRLEQFFSTFVTIAVTILAFIGSFYGAFLVYFREKQDNYCESLIQDFQRLNDLVINFSILEDLTRPPSWSWFPPIGKVYSLLEPESWKQNPMEVLKESVKRLEEEYQKAQEKERELMMNTSGRIPARGAIYLEVKFALKDVITLLYREFPPPPGDYKISQPGNIPYAVKSYVRSDFPDNKREFLEWAKRYELYYSGVVELYYRIRPIIYALKQISIEEAESLQEVMRTINETRGLTQREEETLKEIQELYVREANYYESVFQYLRDIKNRVDLIIYKIAMYERYAPKYAVPIGFCLILMAVFGVILPLIILAPFKPEQILNYQWALSQMIPLIFAIATSLAIVFIVLNIMRF